MNRPITNMALWLLFWVLLCIFLASMSGCASYQQAGAAYGDAAYADAKMLADRLAVINRRALCAMPLDALIRASTTDPSYVSGTLTICATPAAAQTEVSTKFMSMFPGLKP